jgi:ABC-2 type transport system permease protein
LVVALIGGAHFQDGLMGVGTLAIASYGMALVAAGWAVGLALRIKSMQAAPLMQTGLFIVIFLSTAQMPINLLTGWLHGVARFNPMTNVLALAREGFLGPVTWAQTWPGLLALAGMIIAAVLFAARGMQKVIP